MPFYFNSVSNNLYKIYVKKTKKRKVDRIGKTLHNSRNYSCWPTSILFITPRNGSKLRASFGRRVSNDQRLSAEKNGSMPLTLGSTITSGEMRNWRECMKFMNKWAQNGVSSRNILEGKRFTTQDSKQNQE